MKHIQRLQKILHFVQVEVPQVSQRSGEDCRLGITGPTGERLYRAHELRHKPHAQPSFLPKSVVQRPGERETQSDEADLYETKWTSRQSCCQSPPCGACGEHVG